MSTRKAFMLSMTAMLFIGAGLISACAEPSPEAEVLPSPSSTAIATGMPMASPTSEPTATSTVTPKSMAIPPTKPTAMTTREPTITPTPACEVECDIDLEGYSIEVTCESGRATTKVNDTLNYEYDDVGKKQTIRAQLNWELTYENTGNTYKIAGTISANFKYGDAGQVVDKTVSYHLTVTGGVFGDTLQTFEK